VDYSPKPLQPMMASPLPLVHRCLLIHLPDLAPARRWFEECNVRAQLLREESSRLAILTAGLIESKITYPDLIYATPPIDYVYVAHLGVQAFRHKVADVSTYTVQQFWKTDPLLRSRFYAGMPYLYVWQAAEEVEHINVPVPSRLEGRISGLVVGEDPLAKPLWDNKVIKIVRREGDNLVH
jgi:hypothetical protein